jgi:putative tryptophan/tyrosine transport system ATP-binding protein
MLALDGLVKRFGAGTAAEVTALDGVSLAVSAGEFVTLIGSNGAGKSTLLRAILGTVVPERGRVTLDGRDLTREPVHRRACDVGRIAQDPGESTCAGMTVEENLAMAAQRGRARGLGWAVTAARREAFRGRLAEVGLGLEGRLGTRAGTLSGGQRQALGLLMATLTTPKVLLLDEHTASLDPKAAELVMAFTGRLVADARLTTLMVTHNMHQAIRWGSRLVMMHAGRVVLDVRGQEKERLHVQELVTKFYEASGTELTEDRLLLSR